MLDKNSNPAERPKVTTKKSYSHIIRKIVSVALFSLFFVSMFYAGYRVFTTPPNAIPPDTPRTQADYILMLLSCIIGIIAMKLPELIENKFDLKLSNGLVITYLLFLFAGVFLGEVRNFFHIFYYWDVILHSLSAAMLAVLGLILISTVNDWKANGFHLSPFSISFFSFCFSVTIGVLWELYEYAADSLLGMNMQKYMTMSGEELVGQAALTDTMNDFIVNVISALIVSVAGYFYIRKKQNSSQKLADSSPL